MVEDKKFFLFFCKQNMLPCHAKMAAKNGNGNTLLLVLEATSYQTIQTYLICLQSCNMQKHQKANFRPAEYVCV